MQTHVPIKTHLTS